MSTPWRSHAASGHHVPPVEMRFIDMFMAALGALIFMAMLLAFLLRFTPRDHVQVPSPPVPGMTFPLRIVTASLPPAQVGQPYEVAFAYRGGSGRVAWTVPAGLREIPAGLRFDPQRGVLTGTPTKRAAARFVLRAADALGTVDQRPFELLVEPPRAGSTRRWEIVSASIAAGILLLIWLAILVGTAEFKGRLATLQEAWSQGRSDVTWQRGLHEEETIRLPAGIDIYRGRLQTSRRTSRVVLLVLVLWLAWLAWRIWGA